MGASDFLSGGGPRLGARVLSDFTLARRSNGPETAGRRPLVLQRQQGPQQLSLFGHLEPRTGAIDSPEGDPAIGDDPVADARPEASTRTGD